MSVFPTTTLSLIRFRWCACDYLQRMVGPDVKRWERRCRDPRRMLFRTSAALAFCLTCTDVRCSWTKYRTSESPSFPRNCVIIAYPFDSKFVVGSSHRLTPRCTTAGPELPEPAYGVRRNSYSMVHILTVCLMIAGIPTLIRPWFG